MKSCLVTGSFDPFTLGHYDIVRRAAKLFDKVYVAILVNPLKKCLFSVNERLEIAKKSVETLERVEVISYAGMTVELAKQLDTTYLVRGIRNGDDYLYEFEMAEFNRLNGELETVSLFTDSRYDKISSTDVRLRLARKDDIRELVCKGAAELICALYFGRKEG